MTLRTTLPLAAALLLGAAVPALSQATHPATGDTLSDNQTFTYRLAAQFPTLDPQLNEETQGFHIIRQLFEGLMSQDADGNLVPGAAERFEASNDNKTYTFHLRDDARWSNGDPVTAQDFVYGFQRAADPATASQYSWYVELASIVNAAEIIAGEVPPDQLGVRAVDDRTFEVNLTQPLPYFPAMTTYATLFPAHRATIEAHGAAWTQPGNIVSNGAYVLSEQAVNEYVRITKNPEYWDAANVYIEEMTAPIVDDDTQALTRYLAGEIDYTEPLPPGRYPELEAQYPDQTYSTPRLCSYYYAINFTESGNEALKDVRVREALSYAVDRNVIVDQILKGGQPAAYNFTHAATAGFTMPEIEYGTLSQAERDEQAKALIAEAGYGPDNPLTLRLIYNTDEAHQQIATVVSQMWKQKLGVETTLENYEWQSYLDIRGEQNFDLARSAWCGDYNEASTFLDLMRSDNGSNDGRYASEEVDRLLAESKTMADPQPNYTQIEQILAEDMAIIPIYHYTITFMLDPEIRNWPMNNVENNWYLKDIYRAASAAN